MKANLFVRIPRDHHVSSLPCWRRILLRAVPLALAVLLVPVAQAQVTDAPSGLSSANLPSQPAAPEDLLSIEIYGAPELSRTVRVSHDGTIRIPMLAEPVEVAGLMPAAIEERVGRALTAGEILVEPIVTVTIAEYATASISVLGAVRKPLTFEIHEKTTLLDALARAEGLSGEAGEEILVTRSSEGGRPGLTQAVLVSDLIESAIPEANLTLTGGEEVRVPEVGRVTVMGNVERPGVFPVAEADGKMTLRKALALAEGLAPFATKEAYLYRPREDGGQEEVKIELREIMDRKQDDVTLMAGDILYVPDNRARRRTSAVLDRIVSFAAGTASGALILGLGRR